MKPLHVAKGEKHVIIFPPNDINNIYLMTLSEFKQITFTGLIAIFTFLATGFGSL